MRELGTLPRARGTVRSGVAAVAAACAISMLMPALPASGAPPTIGAKQQQARAIMAEIDALDSDLNRAVESYDGARLHLAQTNQAIRSNTRVLKVARHNLRRAQSNIATRLRALYINGDQQSTLEIILGATSLNDLLDRVDAEKRVAAADAAIVRQTRSFRSQVTAHQRALIANRKRATKLVAAAASTRNAIEASLAHRRDLLASVQDEIDREQAAEQRRQLLVAAQVRARLAEQKNTAPPQPPSLPSEPAAPQTTSGQPATTDWGAPPAPPVVAAPPSRYGAVVSIALRYLGIPYQWGGASPASGFDCSGFTMYVYAQIGVALPHYTGDQWVMGTAVARSDLQAGDLVFFDGLGHEGIYIGDNQFIHAPHTGDVVKISSISGWYADTYVGARRL